MMNFYIKVSAVALLPVFFWSCANNKKSSDPGPQTCLTSADSAAISFSKDIFPIIQTECTPCHNSTNASSGYIFENYQNISDKASDIRSAITASNGFQLMPQAGPLDRCKIEKISTWIKNGKPNN